MRENDKRVSLEIRRDRSLGRKLFRRVFEFRVVLSKRIERKLSVKLAL